MTASVPGSSLGTIFDAIRADPCVGYGEDHNVCTPKRLGILGRREVELRLQPKLACIADFDVTDVMG